MTAKLKSVLLTCAEWLFLLLLWAAFVSKLDKDEFLVGVLAASLGAIADFVVKIQGFAKFKPKLNWLVLIFWEPWYALDGGWVVLKAIESAIQAGQVRRSR
jgi:hypothetical protein